MQEVSLFSTSSPALIVCRFSDDGHSDLCEVVPHCGFDLHFSNNNNDPMDCSLPGSCIRGIFQAGVLQGVAISFSRGSSQPRDGTQVSHIAGRCSTA